jgi:hypothetical protein
MAKVSHEQSHIIPETSGARYMVRHKVGRYIGIVRKGNGNG